MIPKLVLLAVFLFLFWGCGVSLAEPMGFEQNFMGEESYVVNDGMVTSVYNWGYLAGLPCIVINEKGEVGIGEFPRIPAGLVQVTNAQTGEATMMAYWKYAEPSLVTSGKAQKADGKWQMLDIPESIYTTFKDVPILWDGVERLAEGCEEIYRMEGVDSVSHTTEYEGEDVEAFLTSSITCPDSNIKAAGYHSIAIPRDDNGRILGGEFQTFVCAEIRGGSGVLNIESQAVLIAK